ncbi:MAG: hypothetical protein WC254_02915 [Candidatus Woesearchaeota archaeon]|jgi:hypothetical protein
MKEEQLKLMIVLFTACVAVVGLITLYFTSFQQSFYLDLSGQVIEVSSNFGQELSIEEIGTEEIIPASAGCCNWDCNDDGWSCRVRSMKCSVGKPVFVCNN